MAQDDSEDSSNKQIPWSALNMSPPKNPDDFMNGFPKLSNRFPFDMPQFDSEAWSKGEPAFGHGQYGTQQNSLQRWQNKEGTETDASKHFKETATPFTPFTPFSTFTPIGASLPSGASLSNGASIGNSNQQISSQSIGAMSPQTQHLALTGLIDARAQSGSEGPSRLDQGPSYARARLATTGRIWAGVNKWPGEL